ncbi:MAG: GNAT family N-acetyltransferase [Candidatus Zixiibacteriota bacterium]
MAGDPAFSFEIKDIPASETRPLRRAILRPHQRPEDLVYTADDDPRSFHLGAFDSEKLISVASFLFDSHPEFSEEPQFRIRGMATLPDWRGQGIGMKLLESALRRIRSEGAVLVWCNARETAFGFYEKAGFEYFGEMFEPPGIGPHKVMWKRL